MWPRFFYWLGALLLPPALVAVCVWTRDGLAGPTGFGFDAAIYLASLSAGCSCAIRFPKYPASDYWIEDRIGIGFLYLVVYAPFLLVCFLGIAANTPFP